MRTFKRLVSTIVIAIMFLAVDHSNAYAKADQRIVSMAPSITEVLYALGLGESVVGVTRFCLYPANAQTKAKVGGFLDPNYEVILSLRPSMVLLLEAHRGAKLRLEKLGIKTMMVDHDSVEGILNSIKIIGNALGAGEKAKIILDSISGKLKVIAKKVSGIRKPKILISVNRSFGAGEARSITVAGQSSFYDDILHLAGGFNAYDHGKIAYPKVSAEGLLSMRPDYIFDVIPTLEKSGLDKKSARDEWSGMAFGDLFKNNRIKIVTDDYWVIPGPRFIKIVDEIARLTHPEIKWN